MSTPTPETDGVLITEAEWRAVLTGSRALRDAAGELRRAGADRLAAESDRHAEVLEGLGRRATVAAAREHRTPEVDVQTPEEQAYAMYEALTDPLDRAVREHEAAISGQLVPSDDELRAEFDEVCRELGLRPGPGDLAAEATDPEREAER